jgi:hypothetical protein
LRKAAAKKFLPGADILEHSDGREARLGGPRPYRRWRWGAINEVARDLMIADVVEPIVFPAVLHTVDGLTNLLAPGLNAPGRDRYYRRDGRTYDLRTGKQID